jgi:hypothetical protein
MPWTWGDNSIGDAIVVEIPSGNADAAGECGLVDGMLEYQFASIGSVRTDDWGLTDTRTNEDLGVRQRAGIEENAFFNHFQCESHRWDWSVARARQRSQLLTEGKKPVEEGK